jgi:hypothetical protein
MTTFLPCAFDPKANDHTTSASTSPDSIHLPPDGAILLIYHAFNILPNAFTSLLLAKYGHI